MMDSAEFHWLSLVAVPMLAVRSGAVVAMNEMAAALFADVPSASSMELSSLFGAAAEPVASLLRWEGEGVPPPMDVTCTLAGVPRRLAVAARPVNHSESLWALTISEAVSAPENVAGDGGWVELLPAMLNQLPVALLIEDANDVGVFANRGFTDIFGYELAEIAALDDWWRKLYPDAVVREAARLDWAAKLAEAPAGDGTISTSEFQIRSGNGADKMLQTHSFRIGGYRVHTYVDVSHRHQMTLALQVLADTDALTGVLNRRSFFQQAGTFLRTGQPLAVLLLDVDHFKLVNDRHGHAFGDAVLVEIATRCRAALRSADILARLGGEEFAVLLPGQDEARAAAVAERLRQAMANTAVGGPQDGQAVTVSIGGACAATGEVPLEELLLRADRALYAAKRAGRNCVRFHSSEPAGPTPADAAAPVQNRAQTGAVTRTPDEMG